MSSHPKSGCFTLRERSPKPTEQKAKQSRRIPEYIARCLVTIKTRLFRLSPCKEGVSKSLPACSPFSEVFMHYETHFHRLWIHFSPGEINRIVGMNVVASFKRLARCACTMSWARTHTRTHIDTFIMSLTFFGLVSSQPPFMPFISNNQPLENILQGQDSRKRGTRIFKSVNQIFTSTTVRRYFNVCMRPARVLKHLAYAL